MKKFILAITLLMVIFSINGFAQTKTDTTIKTQPKIIYKPDSTRVYTITLQVQGIEIFGITSALRSTLDRNPKLTGDKIGDFQDNNKNIAKMVEIQAVKEANDDYKKWQLDSTAKALTNTKKAKPKK